MVRLEKLLATNQVRSAEIEAKKAIQSAPQRGDLRLALAKIHLQMGKLLDAEVDLDLAKQKGLPPEEVLPVLGSVLLAAGEQVKLLSDLDPDAPASPRTRATILALRASAQVDLGMIAEATRSIEAAQASTDSGLPELEAAKALLSVATNQPDKAEAAIAALLQQDPGALQALLLKAVVALKRQDSKAALDYYDQALAAHPGAAAPRIGRAVLLYSLNRKDDARKDVDLLRDILPNNPQIRLLDAQLLADSGKSRQAWDVLLPAIADLNHNAAAQILAGTLSLQRGQLAQARDFASVALSLMPDAPQGARLMASVEQREGNADRAAARLEAAFHAHPDDTLIMADLAELYGALGRAEAAAQLFERAAVGLPQEQTLQFSTALAQIRAGDPTSAIAMLSASGLRSNPLATGALAAILLGQGRFDEARRQAMNFAAQDPKSPMADTLLGRIDLVAGDALSAKAHFEAALSKSQNFVPALQGLATYYNQQNNPAAAIAGYEAAAQRDPANELLQLGLINAIAASGDRSRALAVAAKASAALPRSFPIGAAYIGLLLQGKQFDRALSVAIQRQAASPQDPAVMGLLAKVQLASGQPSSAVATLRLMAQKAPGVGDLELAKLLVSLGRKDDARAALDAGLVKAPAQFDLWQMRLADEYQRKGPQAALALAATARGASPALAETLTGDLYLDQGNFAEAARSYRQAYDHGGPANAHLLLQRLLRALAGAGKIDDAVAVIQEWLKGHPLDLSVREALADLLFSAGRYAVAESAYRGVLAQDPANANSLNNLALTLSQLHQDDQALETARRAHAAAPANPAISDTLGWFLLQKDEVSDALTLLAQAHRASGDLSIAFHLAVAYDKSGDKTQSLSLLAPLVKGPAFAEKADAIALYRKLGGS